MPITIEDVCPEETQSAGNALAQGISAASHGLNYAVMLYAFGKIVAMMSRRTDAGSVDALTKIIGAVAHATIREFGDDATDED